MSSHMRSAAARSRHEVAKVKGSRFIATVEPVRTPADVEACLAGAARELPGATHHCWAYRLGRQGSVARAHDDGEPGGTAGRPILQQLVVRGLTNTLVVVTRFFGGTKLGAGGLVRAYSHAASEALDRAALREMVPLQVVAFTFAYEASGAVRSVLAAHALEPVESSFGSEVTFVLHLPEASAAQICQELLDCTAGRGRIEPAPAPDL
jgi:uncharacterized YigZ family protein